MADRPTIFVSAVSGEFRSFREAVCNVLLARGVFPLVQEGFPTDYRQVREMLTDYIAQSDAVLCIVGFAYGFEPGQPAGGEPRRSYAQLEYHIAREMGKPVYVLVSDETACPCDNRPTEEPAKRQLQLKHREDVCGRDDIWYPFASKDELRAQVAKIELPEAAAIARAGSVEVAPTRLRHGAETLFGREDELARLNAAWHTSRTHVVSIVAWGGVGKTSLVMDWMARLAAEDWRGAERVFDWTFYSQGTRAEGGASADQFVNAALTFFGDPEPTAGSPWDKGARLAQLVAGSRTLLVLDGLEPLQHPPGPMAGRLKDPTLQALLKGLAQKNPGLCLLTTRERVPDLAPFRERTAQEWELEHLSDEAGAALLRQAGVHGSEGALRDASREVGGHALTLHILGSYLARAHGGDIRRRDRVRFEKADAYVQGGHAFRAMAAYETWLADSGEDGLRELAVLRLMGFFDRPATPGCLAALRTEPVVEGLNEHLVGLSGEDWNVIVSDLEEAGLLRTSLYEARQVKGVGQQDDELVRRLRQVLGYAGPEGPGIPAVAGDAKILDAHPLVREYFARQLRDGNPEACREGHRRLYEHLKRSVPYHPEGLEGLQPLYQAVVHGCHAGLHEEARADVYRDRILRGEECYSTFKLGAVGADLGAIACFFEEQWSRLAPGISAIGQAWLLNEAAFSLRSLGRLTEALEPMRAALGRLVRAQDWRRAAQPTSNLSELELTLGRVADAVRDAEQGVDFADRTDDSTEHMKRRTTLADALHQAGRREEARERFREAEAMQAERQPGFPLLYSLQGFSYCDLLLAEAERAAWHCVVPVERGEGHRQDACATAIERCREVEERAAQALKWADEAPEASLLDFALNHLSLGLGALYRALLKHSALPIPLSALDRAREQLDAAVDGLRVSGNQADIPRGLLSRAWLRFVEGDEAGARADLEEAWEIAERGPMRLFMADVLLYRARLFRDGEALAEARKLIEACGYHRRDGELRDAEEAMGG